MPYLPFLNDEEEKKKQAAQNISGSSTVINPTSSQSISSPKPVKRSGSWTNLNAYLDANKENAEKMGQEISKGVEDKGKQAQQTIDRVSNTQVSTKTLQPNEFLNSPQILSPDAKKEYQQYRKDGGYLGPKNIEEVVGAQDIKDVDNASSAAKALQTEEGRFATLEQKYKRPDYRQGQKVFDNLLLQGNPVNRDKMKEVSDTFGGLKSNFDNVFYQKGKEINDKQTLANAQKEALTAIEKQSWDDLLNPIKQRAKEENDRVKQSWDRVNADIQDSTLNQETMEMLGLRGGEAVYDLPLSQFTTPDLTERGVNNVANQEERAKYQALASLLEDETRQEIGSEDASLPGVTFNRKAFETAQNQKKAELEGILNSAAETAQLDQPVPYVQGQPSHISNYDEITPYLDALKSASNTYGSLIERIRAGEDIGNTGSAYSNRIRDIALAERAYKNLINPRRILPAGMKDLPNPITDPIIK